MYDVVVRIFHVVTFVGGDDTDIGHQTKLSSEGKWFLVGSWVRDADNGVVVNHRSIVDRVVAAAKLGKHLGLGQVPKTSLVDLGPINHWNWRTVYWRSWADLGWRTKITGVEEDGSQLRVDGFHHLLSPSSPRLGNGEHSTWGSNADKLYQLCCQILLHLFPIVFIPFHCCVRVGGHVGGRRLVEHLGTGGQGRLGEHLGTGGQRH